MTPRTTTTDTYVNSTRLQEFWTAIKTALAGKADAGDLNNYTTPDAVATAITSALANYATNASVQTAIATALAKYMTSAEVEQAIADAVVDASGIRFEAVEALPESGEANVIYLVPSAASAVNNAKDEYMWLDSKWELFGSTAVDLSGYWSKDALRAMTADELQAILV